MMNIDHTPVECFLTDYYAGDWVDQMDELKTNIDERTVITNAGAYALGRKTDELIIARRQRHARANRYRSGSRHRRADQRQGAARLREAGQCGCAG